MKTYFCFTISCLFLMLFSCNKGDDVTTQQSGNCNSGKIVKSVAGTEGVIYYNTSEKAFTVISTIPNTYDSQDIGILCELSENLKIDGQKVVFSGDYRKYDKVAPIGGQTYYYLEVSKISAK